MQSYSEILQTVEIPKLRRRNIPVGHHFKMDCKKTEADNQPSYIARNVPQVIEAPVI